MSFLKFRKKSHHLLLFRDASLGNTCFLILHTGLLKSSFNYLKRTVLIADKNNVIRYVDLVPGGGLPDIEKALGEAKRILDEG